MRFRVICRHPKCAPERIIADCRNRDDAAGCVRRHHALVGHRPDVEPRFDTPLEGLVF